jgi:subtilisin-like proprotein convertase family protein
VALTPGRTIRRTLGLAVQFIGLTAWLSLGLASGHLDRDDPPSRQQPLSIVAEAAHDSATPRMVAQVSMDSPWAAAGPTSSAPPARRRIRVNDADVRRFLTDGDSRLVAGYGSFQVLDVDEATAAALTAHEGVDVLHDDDVIMLNAGPIKTTSPQAASARGLTGPFAGRRLHLIQFAGPVQEAWLGAVKQTGVQIVTYIPSNSYLVYGEASSIGQLQSVAQASPFVRWDGAYLDGYKVHPRARTVVGKEEKPAGATDHFTIQMVDDPAANAASLVLIDSLKLAPILSQNRSLGYLNVIVRLPPSRLVDVARQPEVISIQPYVVPRLFDERQSQIVAGNVSGNEPSGPGYLAWLASRGFTQQQFTTSGFAVDVTDDGLDDATTTPNHFGLYANGNVAGQSRVVYVRREPPGAQDIRGCSGHGTLNAHIVGGYNNLSGFPHADPAGFRYGLGVAPFVRLGASVIFTPGFTFPDFEDLQSRAYADGARISTNSWGDDTAGAYDSDAQRYDALVRDAQPAGSAVAVAGNQEMVIVFAAGNAGPATGTVGSPASGKNVLAVGASENVHSQSTANGGNNVAGNDGCNTSDSGANSLDDVIAFSSRGPSSDGRVRPDLVAPGTHVTGGVFQATSPGPNGTADGCFDASGVCGLPGSGTVGDPDNFFPLGQQFYTTSTGTSHATPAVAGGAALVRQWFLNQGMSPASPAMTKAVLMNSARYLAGAGANDTLPSPSQGMGLMDLGRAFDGTPRIVRDQVDLFTATGQSLTWTGTISDPSKPFRVTLAWTDAPGNTAGSAFNNDLDLTVVVGGVVYKGNVFNGPSSVAGGSADPRNNAESVWLPAGTQGPFAVIVTAANINSNGVPNNASALDQDFALVVYNAVAANLPVLATQSVAVVGGNGAIDPNECSDVDVVLKNWGTATATGVFATLATSTQGVGLSQAGAAYPDLAPGGTATNTTPFRISTAADFVCGTTIALTATVTTGQGTVIVPLGIGSGSLSSTDFASADVPKAIADQATVESTVTVAGITGPIDTVTVSLHLTHTFDGDLDLFLVGPDGTIVEMTSDNGGPGDNYGTSCGARTVFDDVASTTITLGTAPFVGAFRPEQPLSAFAGKSGSAVNGAWTLRLTDDFAADVGSLLCWTLTISHATSCVAGTGPCNANQSFVDVPPSHVFSPWIEALVHAGITGGCGTNPPRYCPDQTVTRGQMAVFLLRGIHGAAYTPPAPSGIFADVPVNHPFAAWIEQLFAEGITSGCGTNPLRYCPDHGVTRGAMAIFLLRSKHGAGYQPPDPTGIFADVPLGHPFARWIEQLAGEGITSGCATNPARYCPDDAVTRGQMAVFLVRAFGLPL